MDALTDETLTHGQANPAELFGTVYGSFAASVLGYLKARGVDDPEAVTHDVFLGLYPQLSSISGGVSGLRTLIFSIAHARCVDHHRRIARNPMITEFRPELDTRWVASAEDGALESATDSGALDMLSRLGDDQREALGLRIIAGLSIDETAAIMNKTPGAIKQLQRRALSNLRQNLTITAGEAS